MTGPQDSSPDNPQTASGALAAELPPQYELVGRVSEGGMGEIFKARNRYTNALYAIKILHEEFKENQDVHDRFFLEAKVASALKHPNICQFHDFGITNSGTPYLVMEWIEGINLQKKVNSDGPLPADEVTSIFLQAAAGLEYAHAHRLVHRDLKPDNIMLSRHKFHNTTIVHIVDFGIAKLTIDEQNASGAKGFTQTGMIVGTPLYMSPEQARARDVDQRSDVYSLGCVMYFALTGQPPFEGDSIVDTMFQHVNQEVPRFDAKFKVPESLAMIVYKSMEKLPVDRYQDITAMAADLRKVNVGITVERRPLAKDRFAKRKTLIQLLYFVLGFAAIYILSLFVQDKTDPSQKQPSATQTQATSVIRLKTPPKAASEGKGGGKIGKHHGR